MKIHSRVLRPLSALLVLLPALGSPAAGEDVSLFLGSPGTAGGVEIHDAEGILGVRTPPLLQGLVLLPLDFVGRTSLDELRLDRPRLRTDVPGAARLVLPGGRGSLYRYRRDDTNGGPSAFGLFLVDAAGTATSLWEVLGTGVAGQDDPHGPKIAVAPDGGALLVTTTLAAGGDLFELDLDGGRVLPRTAQLGPRAWCGDGLVLLDTWGVAMSAHGVLRFPRARAGDARLVPLPVSTASWIGGECGFSEDRSPVAVVAGTSPPLAHVFALRAHGGPVQVGTTPGPLSGAGFLPDVVDGPHIALSTDGSHCMWRVEGPLAREVFLAPVGSAVLGVEFPVTDDAHFIDTLDHAGELMARGPDSFLLAVGERADPVVGGVENGDVYRVDVGVGGGSATVTNVSLTSGDTTVPFGAGGHIGDEIPPHAFPGTGWLLVAGDPSGGLGELYAVEVSTGAVLSLVTAVKNLDLVEVVGSNLVLCVRRRPAGDFRELLRVPLAQPAGLDVLATLPATTLLTRPAVSGGGWLAAVATDTAFELAVRIHPATGTIEAPGTMPLPFGPTLGFTPSGDLAVSVGSVGNAALFVVWTKTGAASLLPVAPQPGWILPGI